MTTESRRPILRGMSERSFPSSRPTSSPTTEQKTPDAEQRTPSETYQVPEEGVRFESAEEIEALLEREFGPEPTPSSASSGKTGSTPEESK